MNALRGPLMSIDRIAGVMSLLIGGVLLAFAVRASDAPMAQLSHLVSGQYTDQTMWLLSLGFAAVGGGIFLAVFGARTA